MYGFGSTELHVPCLLEVLKSCTDLLLTRVTELKVELKVACYTHVRCHSVLHSVLE